MTYEPCPAEMSPSFLEARLSVGCTRVVGHSGPHASASEDLLPVTLKDDWRDGSSRPGSAIVRIEWAEDDD